MLPTLLTQMALPVGLITWLAFAPARSFAGYCTQTIGTGLALLALALIALWMLLPWWLPLAYGMLWLLAILVKLRQPRPFFPRLWPDTYSSWSWFVIMFALGVSAAYLTWQAVQGRELPNAEVADIPLPLGPGSYLVANGGSRKIVNGHMMTMDPAVERFRTYRGQSYGIDVIKIDEFGLRSSGIQPRNPKEYYIYGEPVFAPCDGIVIGSRNDRPDMPVPIMDLNVIEGNHVLLNCGDFVLLLAHFQPGSVRVRVDDRVSIGEKLGVVGNSGKTMEPHLHISAQRDGSQAQPLSGEPLAITIDGRYLVRNDLVRIGKP
jgi:hypothetical protein